MTPTAERVHKFICQFQVQHGVTPTRREIRKAFGWRSDTSVDRVLIILQDEGQIIKHGARIGLPMNDRDCAMSRSGYSDDCDEQWQYALWRGTIARATRGKRGQKFFKELLAALDAMPEKRLYREVFDKGPEAGEVCALGALARAKGVDATKLDPEDDYAAEELADKFDVATCLAREVIWRNDDAEWVRHIRISDPLIEVVVEDPPDVRWQKMRDWVAKQIKDTPNV